MSYPVETCIEMDETTPFLSPRASRCKSSHEDQVPTINKGQEGQNNEDWKHRKLNTLLLNAVFEEDLSGIQK
jgi:hypothetical protein